MDPTEETELLFEIAALERQHEADKAKDVQGEADETVVGRETGELGI